MADMSPKRKALKKKLSEDEIDRLVEAQADDDSAWNKPLMVHKGRPASVSIPGDLAARAAFLARVHRAPAVEEWIRRIIQERIELEEVAYSAVKRDLATKAGA